MRKRNKKARPVRRMRVTPAGPMVENLDASNHMPMVCDRCGVAVEPFAHTHFDFQTWRDGRGRSDIGSGRLCPPCGDVVSRMLVYFGKSLGLTTNATLPGLSEKFLGQGGMRLYNLPNGVECAPCPSHAR